MWSKILGHDRTIEPLRKALGAGQIPHALLFCGPDGIGKSRVATGLAQALNCQAQDKAPCEQCLACQKIAKNIHPDCLWIGPEGKVIKIDTLREVKQRAYLHPLEGRAKIFLIDPAETMTDAGANALLKILEEPPSQTFFILITSKPSLLLPTIRSRCQRFDFQPLSAPVVEKILAQAGLASEEAGLRIELAQGSAALALNWDLDLFEKTRATWEKLQMDSSPASIFQLSETLTEEEEKLPLVLQAFGYLAHQQLLAARGELAIEHCTGQWQAVQQGLRLLETYANKRLLIENLLFTLAS